MEPAQEGLTLYWNVVSQPSRAVKAILIAGNLPHKSVHMDLLNGEHKGEEFTKINPKQLVPFIVDDGYHLGESNVILKYLCEKYPSIPETYFPKNLEERSRVD